MDRELLTDSIKSLFGKWRVVSWNIQHSFYQPGQDVFNHIGDWKPLEVEKVNECPSNIIYSGIGEETIKSVNLSEIVFEFSDELKTDYYDFHFLLKNDILNSVAWEISQEPKYCDFSIAMEEVYNYARCKIEAIDSNELTIIERLDNDVADTHLQKIKLERIQ